MTITAKKGEYMKYSKLFLVFILSAPALSAQGVYGYFSDCVAKWMPKSSGASKSKAVVTEKLESATLLELKRLTVEMYQDHYEFYTLFENATRVEQDIIIDYCVKNFDQVKHLQVLRSILHWRPEVAHDFAALAIEHFDKLYECSCDRYYENEDYCCLKILVGNPDPITVNFLHSIIYYNKETVKVLTPLVIQHFDRVGPNVINAMLAYDPSLALVFRPLVIKHFKEIVDQVLYAYEKGTFLFNAILEDSPEMGKEIALLAVQYFDREPKYSRFDKVPGWLLDYIMDFYPESAKLFTPLAVNHFDNMATSVLAKIMKYNPESIPLFTASIMKDFYTPNSTDVAQIIAFNTDEAKKLVAAMKRFKEVLKRASIC